MHPNLQRILAFGGLLLIIYMLGYGIFHVSNVMADYMPGLNRSMVMSTTMVSIVGGMLGVSIGFGRMLGDGLQSE